MAEINAILENLTGALERLGASRVPPPMPYNGTTDVGDFFTSFERYCESIYGNQTEAWLTILPTFTEGEARNIVSAFGTGTHVTYENVKARVVLEMQRRTLGRNSLTDVLTCTRRLNESLLCFSIRLQSMADKVADLPAAQKNMVVKTKFISTLKPTTVTQISIRYGGEANTTIDQIVRLATLLEGGDPMLGSLVAEQAPAVPQAHLNAPAAALMQNITPQQPIVGNPNVAIVTGANSTPIGGSNNSGSGMLRCFKCGQNGHTSRDCSYSAPVCYECRQPGHFGRDCPDRQAREQGNTGQNQPAGRPSHSNSQNNGSRGRGPRNPGGRGGRNTNMGDNRSATVSCGFCGGSHLIKDCREFNDKVAPRCVWCGQQSHASYQCTHRPSGSGN